jgi:hypothetical protein
MQATPDYARLLILSQRSGAPDPGFRPHRNMTVIGYRRLTIVALLSVAALLGVAWHLLMKGAIQQADEMATWRGIMMLERSRDYALRSEPRVAAQTLYEIAYLPPPRTNGPLDWIIQRERQRQAHEIIEYLRKRTGEDLGDDPAKWIENYFAHEK